MKTLSLVLVSLLLLQACAGSISRGRVSASADPTEEPRAVQASAPAEDPVPEKPRRRWWPWVVGGVAVVAVGTVILLAVAFHNFEIGGGSDFDVFGGSGSGDRRNDDDGGTLPVIASR